MATICTYPSQYHEILHWEFVLLCFKKFPGVIIPRQETNTDATNTRSTVFFHVYHNLSRCTFHGIRPYK